MRHWLLLFAAIAVTRTSEAVERTAGQAQSGQSRSVATGSQFYYTSDVKEQDTAPSAQSVSYRSALSGCANGGSCQAGGTCSTCQPCNPCSSCCDWGGGILGLGLLDQLSCCSLGDPIKLFPESCRCVNIGGWTQFGHHNNDDLTFNRHPDHVRLHQGYLFAERVAEQQECCWDWGFRGDIIYGVDAQDTQAFGNSPGNWDFRNGFDHGIYGWALPQAYLQVAGGNWNIKAGKFYTPVGYESVMSPANFFYSRSLTMNYSEPFTHTGFLSTYTVSDNLELYGGWSLGWDTGFNQFRGGSNSIGGFKASVTDDLTITYVNTMGDLGWRGQGYTHSLLFDFTLTDKLNYIVQNDVVSTDAAGAGGPFQSNLNDTVGINQYLIYKYSDCVGIGGRLEWWKFDGTSLYVATGGVNYKPHANLIFRPEIRQQWSPAFDYDETILGTDVILTF